MTYRRPTNFPEKPCKNCSVLFKPIWSGHHYCSARCNLFSRLVPSENGCLVWTGARLPFGYGHLNAVIDGVNQRSIRAHRLAWELERGSIPGGMCLLHSCDNPPCCNVEHLRLGSRKDNADDKLERGRHPRGVFQPTSKLNEQQVREIRAMIKIPRRNGGRGTYAQIAAQYGVSEHAVIEIKRRRSWGWLED